MKQLILVFLFTAVTLCVYYYTPSMLTLAQASDSGEVTDDLGLDDNDGEDGVIVDDVDFTDTDATDDATKVEDLGILPELAEQSEKLHTQGLQLAEEARSFQAECDTLKALPKKLLDTSARLTALAKLPSWQSSALMFNTQAKQLKEQSSRIGKLVNQLRDKIPAYEKESQKLTKQAEGLKEVADQQILQGNTDAEATSTLELRKEINSLEKQYAKMLKKSEELKSSLKQLREQGDMVNQLAGNLPDDAKNVEL